MATYFDLTVERINADQTQSQTGKLIYPGIKKVGDTNSNNLPTTDCLYLVQETGIDINTITDKEKIYFKYEDIYVNVADYESINKNKNNSDASTDEYISDTSYISKANGTYYKLSDAFVEYDAEQHTALNCIAETNNVITFIKTADDIYERSVNSSEQLYVLLRPTIADDTNCYNYYVKSIKPNDEATDDIELSNYYNTLRYTEGYVAFYNAANNKVFSTILPLTVNNELSGILSFKDNIDENPNSIVYVNSEGKAIVELYSNDSLTSLTAVIFGAVTDDGSLCCKVIGEADLTKKYVFASTRICCTNISSAYYSIEGSGNIAYSWTQKNDNDKYTIQCKKIVNEVTSTYSFVDSILTNLTFTTGNTGKHEIISADFDGIIESNIEEQIGDNVHYQLLYSIDLDLIQTYNKFCTIDQQFTKYSLTLNENCTKYISKTTFTRSISSNNNAIIDIEVNKERSKDANGDFKADGSFDNAIVKIVDAASIEELNDSNFIGVKTKADGTTKVEHNKGPVTYAKQYDLSVDALGNIKTICKIEHADTSESEEQQSNSTPSNITYILNKNFLNIAELCCSIEQDNTTISAVYIDYELEDNIFNMDGTLDKDNKYLSTSMLIILPTNLNTVGLTSQVIIHSDNLYLCHNDSPACIYEIKQKDQNTVLAANKTFKVQVDNKGVSITENASISNIIVVNLLSVIEVLSSTTTTAGYYKIEDANIILSVDVNSTTTLLTLSTNVENAIVRNYLDGDLTYELNNGAEAKNSYRTFYEIKDNDTNAIVKISNSLENIEIDYKYTKLYSNTPYYYYLNFIVGSSSQYINFVKVNGIDNEYVDSVLIERTSSTNSNNLIINGTIEYTTDDNDSYYTITGPAKITIPEASVEPIELIADLNKYVDLLGNVYDRTLDSPNNSILSKTGSRTVKKNNLEETINNYNEYTGITTNIGSNTITIDTVDGAYSNISKTDDINVSFTKIDSSDGSTENKYVLRIAKDIFVEYNSNFNYPSDSYYYEDNAIALFKKVTNSYLRITDLDYSGTKYVLRIFSNSFEAYVPTFDYTTHTDDYYCITVNSIPTVVFFKKNSTTTYTFTGPGTLTVNNKSTPVEPNETLITSLDYAGDEFNLVLLTQPQSLSENRVIKFSASGDPVTTHTRRDTSGNIVVETIQPNSNTEIITKLEATGIVNTDMSIPENIESNIGIVIAVGSGGSIVRNNDNTYTLTGSINITHVKQLSNEPTGSNFSLNITANIQATIDYKGNIVITSTRPGLNSNITTVKEYDIFGNITTTETTTYTDIYENNQPGSSKIIVTYLDFSEEKRNYHYIAYQSSSFANRYIKEFYKGYKNNGSYFKFKMKITANDNYDLSSYILPNSNIDDNTEYTVVGPGNVSLNSSNDSITTAKSYFVAKNETVTVTSIPTIIKTSVDTSGTKTTTVIDINGNQTSSKDINNDSSSSGSGTDDPTYDSDSSYHQVPTKTLGEFNINNDKVYVLSLNSRNVDTNFGALAALSAVPIASTEELGGVKLYFNKGETGLLNSNDDNKQYPLLMDNSEKAYVYVPWKNTQYLIADDSRDYMSMEWIDDESTSDGGLVHISLNLIKVNMISGAGNMLSGPASLSGNISAWITKPLSTSIDNLRTSFSDLLTDHKASNNADFNYLSSCTNYLSTTVKEKYYLKTLTSSYTEINNGLKNLSNYFIKYLNNTTLTGVTKRTNPAYLINETSSATLLKNYFNSLSTTVVNNYITYANGYKRTLTSSYTLLSTAFAAKENTFVRRTSLTAGVSYGNRDGVTLNALTSYIKAQLKEYSATFHGGFDSYSDMTKAKFNNPKPDINDYIFVNITASEATKTLTFKKGNTQTTRKLAAGMWRFVMNDSNYVNYQSWWPEYKVSDAMFTDALLNALNSGITKTLVSKILSYDEIKNKLINAYPNITKLLGKLATLDSIENNIIGTGTAGTIAVYTGAHSIGNGTINFSPTKETWRFELEDGSSIQKSILVQNV